eukprot:scaffold3134_cov414-Prasinococcus_capsulatus_cf.AAC.10
MATPTRSPMVCPLGSVSGTTASSSEICALVGTRNGPMETRSTGTALPGLVKIAAGTFSAQSCSMPGRSMNGNSMSLATCSHDMYATAILSINAIRSRPSLMMALYWSSCIRFCSAKVTNVVSRRFAASITAAISPKASQSGGRATKLLPFLPSTTDRRRWATTNAFVKPS